MSGQPSRISPVIWGSIVMTTIAVMPLVNFINLFFCAGIIIGGYFGAIVYSKNASALKIQFVRKDGVMIGLLSGILSAVTVTGINIIMMMYSDVNPALEASKFLQDAGFQFPPEVKEQIGKFADEFNEFGFSPTIAIFSFVSNLILYPVFGMLGGMLGIAFAKKRLKQGSND